MKNTREEYKDFIQMYRNFEEKAEIVLELKHSPVGSIESMEFDEDTISITTVNPAHCGCCSDEYDYFDIKVEDIFKDLDVLKEEARIVKAEKIEKAKIEAEKKKAKKEAEQKAKDEATYLKLKEQFEN